MEEREREATKLSSWIQTRAFFLINLLNVWSMNVSQAEGSLLLLFSLLSQKKMNQNLDSLS